MDEIEKVLLREHVPYEMEEEDEKKEDESVYSADTRDDLVDSDAISPEEAGFMQGYEDSYEDAYV